MWLCVAFVLLPASSSILAQPAQNSASPSRSEDQPIPLTAQQYQRAREYSHARYVHYFGDQGYGFLILLFVLTVGFGSRLQNLAQKITARHLLRIVIFAPLFIVTLSALLMPTDVWDHALSLKYGLSVQPWSSWLSDWLKETLLSLILGTVLIWILYAVIRRSPRRWWFYFWLASLPVLLLVLFVAPVVIEPMFFKFEPLQPKNPQLVNEIEKVVQRAGMDIPPDRMFEMNASSKFTGLNAFVEGFGSTKRVVVWDTTLQKATIPETLVVFGHEMGHYVLLHIPKQIVIDAALLLFLLYLAFRIVKRVLSQTGKWGIHSEADLASLPLLLLVFSTLGFLATPAFTGVSRHFEHEADRYALEVTHGIVPDAQQAGVRFFEISRVTNLADPDPSPFIVFWLYDHPSDPDRIRFLQDYDPWSPGHSPRYVK